jgi:hypothetical protein
MIIKMFMIENYIYMEIDNNLSFTIYIFIMILLT